MGKRKIKEMLFWGFLFVGLIFGILFVNMWGNTYLSKEELYGIKQMKCVAEMEAEPKALFRYLILERGKPILLLWLLGYTAAGIPAALLALGWLGAAAGVLLGTCIIRMRLAGIAVFATAVLPQWICYMPMMWFLCDKIYEKGVLRYKKGQYFDDWKMEKQYISVLLMGAALLAAGALLESFGNPWLVRQTVKYFF